MGLWQYSLAMMIIVAAILDAVWWVPSHSQPQSPRPNVPTHVSRCR